MKHTIRALVCLATASALAAPLAGFTLDTRTVSAASGDVAIDASHFPDEVFRGCVSNFDIDKDGILSSYELSQVKTLDCAMMGISSVKGVEYFTELTKLDCRQNSLKELDVHTCTKLEILDLRINEGITALDVSHNPNLTELQIERSGISVLDLSKNTKLTELSCLDTKIRNLDISNCPDLVDLYCLGNPNLSSLDVSHNTKLESLLCGDNPIKKLDVRQLSELRHLSCNGCGLTELDIGRNPKLESLSISDNAMTKIDLSGNSSLDSLMCSRTKITEFDFTGCQNLTELSFENLNAPKIDFAQIPNLKVLICTDSSIEELDLHACVKLENLFCSGNKLESLDISNNSRLQYFDCYDNNLKTLDLSANDLLSYIDCSGNDLSELKLNQPALETVKCSFNHIKSLDLSMLTYLKKFEADANELTSISFKNNSDLSYASVVLNHIAARPSVPADADLAFFPQRNQLSIKNLHLESRTKNSVTIAWNKLSEDDESSCFEVWRSTSSDDGFSLVGDSYNEENTYIDDMAKEGVTYYYKVRYAYKPEYYADKDSVFGEFSSVLKVDAKEQSGGSFEDFVERLYTVALNRQSDPEGKKFWTEQVVEQGKTGADCARFFLLDADEFMKRNLSVEDFVETLYATFFDRASDAAGKAGWVNAIRSGAKTRVEVVNDFIESTEWCDVCASYGVKSGALYHKATRPSVNAEKFATRLYTCCLKRDPEQDGLRYWALALTNLEKTGAQAAQFFFEGDEFVGLNTSNEEYLTRLYTTFMDRTPSSEEIRFWIGEINGGRQTRKSILAFFVQSQEFTGICKKYGIERGTI